RPRPKVGCAHIRAKECCATSSKRKRKKTTSSATTKRRKSKSCRPTSRSAWRRRHSRRSPPKRIPKNRPKKKRVRFGSRKPAGFRLPSLKSLRTSPAGATDYQAWQATRMFAAIEHFLAVDEDVLDACRVLVGTFERGEVVDALGVEGDD